MEGKRSQSASHTEEGVGATIRQWREEGKVPPRGYTYMKDTVARLREEHRAEPATQGDLEDMRAELRDEIRRQGALLWWVIVATVAAILLTG